MKGGTCTTSPVSSFAGLVTDDAVADLIPGSVSITVISTTPGSSIPTALPSWKLTLIDNQVDQATGTIHLKAVFDNQEETLWPGQFVNMRLVVSIHKSAVTVPSRAVQQGPNGDYIFVIKPDDTVELRTVQVEQVDQGLTVIAKGLAAGERVVVDGQYRLDQGTRVSVQPGPKPSA